MEILDNGATLVLTGSNNGSGLGPFFTDLTIQARGSGLFSFDYVYTSADIPGFDSAGYLLGGYFHFLADTDGMQGSVAVPVVSGDLIGFRVASVDNQGEPGILTVTNFSAPAAVPEPSTFLLTLGALLVVGSLAHSRRSRKLPFRWLRMFLIFSLLGAKLPIFGQQADYTGTDITGALKWVRVVNLRQQTTASRTLAAPKGAGETKPKSPPPRLRPPQLPAFMAFGTAAVTPARSLPPTFSKAVTGFNALSHLDQRLAYGGNQFSIEPPSQAIAVGNGYILEGVNNAVQVYTATGTPALPSVLASNELFGLPPEIDWNTNVYGVYLTDMRVYYDQDVSRWFVIQRSQDNDAFGNPLATSHLYLAVSKTNDPAGQYNIYVMDTTNAGHPGCPCIADYPQVGADQYGFHISWNQFNSFSLTFVDAAVTSFSKAALAAGINAPAAYQITVPFTTGYEFAIQPATTPVGASAFLAAGGVEYFVSTIARSSSGSAVSLWALRNTSSLSTPSRSLVLSRVFVPTLAYAFPDVATQRPGPLPYGDTIGGFLAYLDGGDTRVLSLSYAGGRLYLTLQTAVQDESGRWCVGGAYIVMSPVFRANVLNGSVLNQGYLMTNGNHLLRPAIAVNAQGRGAIAVTLVGPDWFPSAAVIPFQTLGAPSTLEVAGLGAQPEDGFTGYPDFGGVGVARWGDYNGAVAADDGNVWLVAQYVGAFSRTTYANWNTFVMYRTP